MLNQGEGEHGSAAASLKVAPGLPPTSFIFWDFKFQFSFLQVVTVEGLVGGASTKNPLET